jgi:predicted enzyme related to lactoylglutathione lyase
MTKRGIGWIDLTVDDAVELKGFYAAVTGMDTSAVSMGEYDDFCLNRPGGDAVAGVCHRRGDNASVPPGWMVYFTVANLDAAIEAAKAGGGELVHGPGGGMAFVRDPAGNHFALYQVPDD